MLAVALLAFSDAYTYQTFFKVFTIVVIFGLFYGTFLLPVILSIFAPNPYDINRPKQQPCDGTELKEIRKPEESELISKQKGLQLLQDKIFNINFTFDVYKQNVLKLTNSTKTVITKVKTIKNSNQKNFVTFGVGKS